MTRPVSQMAAGIILAGILVWLSLHSVVRAVGLFGDASVRPLILTSFLLLWPTPFLLLDREGRRAIGLYRLPALGPALISTAAGGAFALACFAVCFALFGAGADNPFISVRDSYFSGAPLPQMSVWALFAVFTIPALIFSPIGEEVFCRGVIAHRIGQIVSANAGVLASALVFACLHLLHHGLIYAGGDVGFRWASGALWFALMFAASVLFSTLRRRTHTIWAAVLAHAGFNLAMNAAIFASFAVPSASIA